jgi:hypothetical protein
MRIVAHARRTSPDAAIATRGAIVSPAAGIGDDWRLIDSNPSPTNPPTNAIAAIIHDAR